MTKGSHRHDRPEPAIRVVRLDDFRPGDESTMLTVYARAADPKAAARALSERQLDVTISSPDNLGFTDGEIIRILSTAIDMLKNTDNSDYMPEI